MATFGEALNRLQIEGNDGSAVIPDDWAQGRTVFGGLQVALAVRAMRGAMGAASALPLRCVQATFVAPLPTGQPIQLRADVLRTGRAVTHARCDLLHDGVLACTAVGIFGASRPSSITLDIPRPPAPVAAEALQDMRYVPGLTPEFIRHLQLRWAQGTPPYTGRVDPRTLIYARLRDGACSAEDTLIALADSIPTPALSMLTKRAPASSVNWMLELIGDPGLLGPDDWSLIGTEVRAGADGYLSQTSVLWGPGGHAFSVSHQTVAIFG